MMTCLMRYYHVPMYLRGGSTRLGRYRIEIGSKSDRNRIEIGSKSGRNRVEIGSKSGRNWTVGCHVNTVDAQSIPSNQTALIGRPDGRDLGGRKIGVANCCGRVKRSNRPFDPSEPRETTARAKDGAAQQQQQQQQQQQ